jgi:hypothetical protein
MGIFPPEPIQTVLQYEDVEMVTAPVSGEQSAIKIDTKATEVKFEIMSSFKDTAEHKPCLVDDVAESHTYHLEDNSIDLKQLREKPLLQ